MRRTEPSIATIRAAIYVRVSTEEQGDKNLSIPFQIEACQRMAETSGWEVTEVYADIASGKSDKRPNFQRLLADARAKKFDQIIVYKYSRFGRNDAQTGMHEATLLKHGVVLRSATEPFDPDTSAGWLGKRMVQIFAEFENKQKAELVRSGMRQRALEGGWSWKAPWGYCNRQEQLDGRNVRRWIEPDPAIAPLVVQAFELFASGDYNLRSLAEEMTRRGMRASQGGRLREQRLQSALKNPFYHGVVCSPSFDVRVTGKHEPLISKELFDRAQAMLATRGRQKRRVKHGQVLRGIVWCACGQRMTFDAPNRGRFVYLRCLSHADKRRDGCRQAGPRLDAVMKDLEERVLPSLCVSADDFELVRAELARQASTESGNAEEELRGLVQRLAAEEGRRERLLELRLDGEVHRDEYEAKRRNLEGTIALMAARKAELEDLVRRRDADVDLVLKIANSLALLWSKADEAERRELLQTVVEKVVVGNGTIVNVVLRTPFRWLPVSPK